MKGTFSFKISRDIHLRLKIQAAKENTSMSELLERIVKEYTDKAEKEGKSDIVSDTK